MNEPSPLDFSLLPYEDWVRFLFNRDNTSRYEEIADPAAQPAVLIDHMARLCVDLPGLVRQYTWPQINRGLWAALTDPFEISEHLADYRLPLEPRKACIRAMHFVYRDVAAKIPDDVPMENIFYMWWHIICTECAGGALHDEILLQLKQILEMDDDRCQQCALHGLGHVMHPRAPALVQRYLDRNRRKFQPDTIKWIESCRDGTVM